MADASYIAWDDNLYEWPPPDGWYEASDGKWWPDGYGPGPSDGSATASSDGAAAGDGAVPSPPPADDSANGDDDELPNIDDVFGGVSPFSDDEPPARRLPDGPVAIDDLLPPDDGDAAAEAAEVVEAEEPELVSPDAFAPTPPAIPTIENDPFSMGDGLDLPDEIDTDALSFDQLAPDLVEPDGDLDFDAEPVASFDTPSYDAGVSAFDQGHDHDHDDDHHLGYADPEPLLDPDPEPEPVLAQGVPGAYEARAEPMDPEVSARNVLDRHRASAVAAQPATQASAPSIRRESSRGVGRAVWPLLLAGACLALVAALVLAFFVNRNGSDDDVNPATGATAGRGSFDQPWSLGTGVVVFYNDDVTEQERRWVIQVLAPASNGTERFVTNGGATAPPEGEILAFTRVRVTYQSGPAPGSLTDLTLDAAGPTSEVYTTEANACDGVVDAIDLTGELDVSGSVEGNICWRIPAGDLTGLRLAVRADPAEGTVHLLLS